MPAQRPVSLFRLVEQNCSDWLALAAKPSRGYSADRSGCDDERLEFGAVVDAHSRTVPWQGIQRRLHGGQYTLIERCVDQFRSVPLEVHCRVLTRSVRVSLHPTVATATHP